MQATKSSRNKFCERENAVVIVNLVHRGKKIGRIGVCEGDNAYQLADDFLKKRRDVTENVFGYLSSFCFLLFFEIPSSKRNALAKILITSLDRFTKW